MGIETRKKPVTSSKNTTSENMQKPEKKTDTSNNQKASDTKRNNVSNKKDDSLDYYRKGIVSVKYVNYSPFSNSLAFLHSQALGSIDRSKFSKFRKAIIVNNLKKFDVHEFSCPFDRRITSVAWHPMYPNFSVSGSKGGDLYLRQLKACCNSKDGQDYFIHGVGAGGSVLGVKFCCNDPCLVYTACMTGKISLVDFHRQNSKVLLNLPLAFDNWFTCLDMCYNRDILMSGDCTGNAYLLKTSGKLIWGKKKLHTSKISHCEFSMCDPNIFVTSSIDRSVKIWDLRSIPTNSSKPQPLVNLSFDRPLNSACFSPSNLQSLLITDQHSKLHVYSSPFWTESIVITHPHRHFQHLTPIKAAWHPLEDIIVVGRYPDNNVTLGDNRTIDFFDASNGDLLHQILSPSKLIVSLNAFNSTGAVLFSAAGHQGVYLEKCDAIKEISSNNGSEDESESSRLMPDAPKKRTKASKNTKSNSKKLKN